MNTTRQRQDDPYVMPVEASRRGAHRARVSPILGALPFVAVAVVVVGVVALAWALFGTSGGDAGSQTAGAISSAPAEGTASQAAQPSSATRTPTASPSQASASQEPSQKPSAEPAPSSTVDKSLKITVRNSTRTKGLAAGAATRLENRGWTINGIPDNYRPTIPSTVFYADDDQKASAVAVAKVLRIDVVTQDGSMATKGITVVLGSDYAR